MSKKGNIIIFSGPSGVGKDTVRSLLNDEELNLGYSVSMTTRKPRPGEVDGTDYHFVSRDRFMEAIENGELLEYTQFVDNFYGTLASEVDALIQQGKNVLLEIEVNGARQILEKVPDAVSVFLLPPSEEELERRIRNRKSESEEQIALRLAQSKEELKSRDLYKTHIINETPEQAAAELTELIKKS